MTSIGESIKQFQQIPEFRSHTVKLLHNSEAQQLLQSPETRRKLFPNSARFVSANYWLPMLVNDENLKSVICSSNVFASFVSENSTEVEGISFNSFTNVANGVRFDLFYYGKNETSFLSHVAASLLHTQKVVPVSYTLHFTIHFPEHFDFDYVYSHIKQVLGEKYEQPPFKYKRMQCVAINTTL